MLKETHKKVQICCSAQNINAPVKISTNLGKSAARKKNNSVPWDRILCISEDLCQNIGCQQKKSINAFQEWVLQVKSYAFWMQLYLPADFGQLEFYIFHFRKETLQCYYLRKLENQSNLKWEIEIEISVQLLSIPQKPFATSRFRFMHHFEEKDVLLID